jgi:hypothetical protein
VARLRGCTYVCTEYLLVVLVEAFLNDVFSEESVLRVVGRAPSVTCDSTKRLSFQTSQASDRVCALTRMFRCLKDTDSAHGRGCSVTDRCLRWKISTHNK